MISIFSGIISKINLCKSVAILGSQLHTSATLSQPKPHEGPRRFLKHNKKVYKPQIEGETQRPAFVCHQTENIKYSPKKMWYVSSFIRGMTVDEAVRQLNFCPKKGAAFVRDTILEAQEMAVKDHHVEFKSNLWVAESFCGKGKVFKGMRRHARRRVGIVEYKHTHYFVRLEEGQPPKDYYNTTVTPEQQLDKWMQEKRKRKVVSSL